MGLFCDECLTPTFILTMAQVLGAREALGNRNHLCTGDKFLTWPMNRSDVKFHSRLELRELQTRSAGRFELSKTQVHF